MPTEAGTFVKLLTGVQKRRHYLILWPEHWAYMGTFAFAPLFTSHVSHHFIVLVKHMINLIRIVDDIRILLAPCVVLNVIDVIMCGGVGEGGGSL